MTDLIRSIATTEQLEYRGHTRISGGDINEAFAIETNAGRVFLKINSAVRYPGMFASEAEGLQALHAATNLKIPTVVAHGGFDNQQYLLLEYVEKASPSPNQWQQLAQGLASIHKQTDEQFGWRSSNYIGSLAQNNKQANTWSEFYATQRILPLTKQLFNAGHLSNNDVYAAETLCNKLGDLFPIEPPSLLHGDLWAGNFMIAKDATGTTIPSIFDPAVYSGHREMDLGMTLLFGGFDRMFYEHYHECFPLENGWRKRVSLTQLYPLLVHAILFGGGYIQQCRSIFSKYQ
jgi:fructosamine-3-kinase